METKSIAEMIRELVQSQVNAAVQSAVNDALGEMRVDAQVAQTNNARRQQSVTVSAPAGVVKSRKRGPIGPRTGYVMVYKGKKEPELFPTALKTFSWIRKHASKKPVTAADIEKGTGLKKKTVESTVWFLRNSGMIKSVAIA